MDAKSYLRWNNAIFAEDNIRKEEYEIFWKVVHRISNMKTSYAFDSFKELNAFLEENKKCESTLSFDMNIFMSRLDMLRSQLNKYIINPRQVELITDGLIQYSHLYESGIISRSHLSEDSIVESCTYSNDDVKFVTNYDGIDNTEPYSNHHKKDTNSSHTNKNSFSLRSPRYDKEQYNRYETYHQARNTSSYNTVKDTDNKCSNDKIYVRNRAEFFDRLVRDRYKRSVCPSHGKSTGYEDCSNYSCLFRNTNVRCIHIKKENLCPHMTNLDSNMKKCPNQKCEKVWITACKDGLQCKDEKTSEGCGFRHWIWKSDESNLYKRERDPRLNRDPRSDKRKKVDDETDKENKEFYNITV